MKLVVPGWIYCAFCGITYDKRDVICPNCGTAPKLQPKKYFKRGSRYVTR